MDKIRIHLIIEGKVQGVWFRDSARNEANRLGLSGWVRNRLDNTVELVAEGQRINAERMVEWCRQGPPMARVDRIHEIREKFTGEFDGFEITF